MEAIHTHIMPTDLHTDILNPTLSKIARLISLVAPAMRASLMRARHCFIAHANWTAQFLMAYA